MAFAGRLGARGARPGLLVLAGDAGVSPPAPLPSGGGGGWRYPVTTRRRPKEEERRREEEEELVLLLAAYQTF